jgi:N-acetylglutamate synthase/N-acetylornithine aminotransferase
MSESKLNGNYKKENNGVTIDGDILTSDSKVVCQTEINGEPVAKSKEKLKQEKDNSVFLPRTSINIYCTSGKFIYSVCSLR